MIELGPARHEKRRKGSAARGFHARDTPKNNEEDRSGKASIAIDFFSAALELLMLTLTPHENSEKCEKYLAGLHRYRK